MKFLYVPIPVGGGGDGGSEEASEESRFSAPVFRPGFSGALGQGNVFTGYFLRDGLHDYGGIYNNDNEDKSIEAAREGGVREGGS